MKQDTHVRALTDAPHKSLAQVLPLYAAFKQNCTRATRSIGSHERDLCWVKAQKGSAKSMINASLR